METEWKEIQGEEAPEFGEFFQWEHPGEVLEGKYKSRRTNPARTGQDGTRFKEQFLYDVEGPAGDLWTLNGNFDLDSKMKKVRPGSTVRITYLEDREMGRAGLSAMRIFKVEVAQPKRAA